MRFFSGAVLALALALTSGGASAIPDRRPPQDLDDRLLVATVAAGLDFIAPRTIEAHPTGELVDWGLRGLTALDATIAVERRADGLRLTRGAVQLLQTPLPVGDNDPAWAATVGKLSRAAWDSSDQVRSAGTAGLLESFFDALTTNLDPYSRYIPPREAQADRARRSGRAGIGATVALHRGAFVVTEIEPGGPAAQAGIRAGDRLLAIDGQPLQGADLDAVAALLAGPEGAGLNVTVQGRGAKRTLLLARVRSFIPSVFARRDGGLAIIRVTGFTRRTAADFAQELLRVREATTPIDGVVIDLRGNRGGLLQQAVATAAMLQPTGVILSAIGRDPDARHISTAEGGRDLAPGVKVVVLIDRLTASAAEILAGALADHRRAVVAGSASQGKGMVQTIGTLPDGGEILVSWSQMLAPRGWSVESMGVLPQLCTSLGEGQTAAQLAALARGRAPLAEALARHRAAGAHPTPLLVSELRAACPPGDGMDADIEAARSLLRVAGAYEAALLPPGMGTGALRPLADLTGAPGASN